MKDMKRKKGDEPVVMNLPSKHKDDSTIVIRNDYAEGCFDISKLRVLECADMVAKGKSKNTIVKYVQDTYDISENQSLRYYAAALKYLLPPDEDGYRREMIAVNMNRLEPIVERCMETGDLNSLRLAKDTISEMNKVLGVTNNKVMVAKDGDKELIQISFD